MAVFDFFKTNDYVAPMEAPPEPTEEAAYDAAGSYAPGIPQAAMTLPGMDGRRLMRLPLADIRPNPNQPRKNFDDDGLEELAESIKQVGLIQPILVRRMTVGFELVAGERRLRACKLLGMQEIPALVEDGMVEQESAVVALIENLQRENLHFLEEAECYAQMLHNYGLTQEELAIRLGKSQSAIANKLRVLRLSPNVKKAMIEARMTERHARTLLKLRDEATQLHVIEQIRARALSVKDTEKLVEKTLNKQYDEKQDGAAPRPKILRYLRDYRMFLNSVTVATKQLEEAGMTVELSQTDVSDGIDVFIRVRREANKN